MNSMMMTAMGITFLSTICMRPICGFSVFILELSMSEVSCPKTPPVKNLLYYSNSVKQGSQEVAIQRIRMWLLHYDSLKRNPVLLFGDESFKAGFSCLQSETGLNYSPVSFNKKYTIISQ